MIGAEESMEVRDGIVKVFVEAREIWSRGRGL